MSAEQSQLEAGIATLESQRALLGDAMVEAMLAPARARLAVLKAAVAEPAQTLKQVSILFLDVVGSTTLSQHLDPEAISAVMDDALKRGTSIVDAHRGKVLQYAGDNLLAAFGVDETREDDSERAVRCGLALLELGRALGVEVKAAHRHDGFDVRIGIHTGGVLLGGGVDADGTIRGIAVNVAARMEQTAPAGALRISHDTYAQVRGLFEVEVQEPLAIKGVDAPMQSYLVTRAKPRSFRIGTRGIEGVATKMIGRDAELEALQTAFKNLFIDRKLAAITVTADAGVGKSRLLFEFASWSEARPEPFFIFRGRANPQTQGQPFGLLRDIVAWRFQIGDDDSLEIARTKMEQGIVPLFEHDDGLDLAEGHAHVLGHLVGIDSRESKHLKGILDDPKQIRNRAFHVTAQLFRRVSAKDGHPIVLQLEDLHWADNESLDFLAYLTEIDRDVPLLLLAFARPTLFERRATWCADDLHGRLGLTPLDRSWSRELANELLKKVPEVPAALRELITGGSEGNPFYMEELVKMLIDQKAIEIGDVWKVNAEKLLVTKVPSTLTGVLQARLDGLPPAERLTLQEASVIGQVFWDRALIALNDEAAITLPSLVSRELALPRTDTSSDDLREYTFKHAMLHQVTYATVLKRSRKELHGKLAHWMAAQTGLRANEFLGVAAEHFEEAGDDVNAAEYHARAAAQAVNVMAHEAVIKHVARALALLDRLPTTDTMSMRWRLLKSREATLDMQAHREAQRSDIVAMQDLADSMNDDERRAYAAYRLSDLSMRIADWSSAEPAGRQAVAWITAAGATANVLLRLDAQRLIAGALARTGKLSEARTIGESTLAEATALGIREVEGRCLNVLVVIADMESDLVLGLDLAGRALRANEAIGNRRGIAIGRLNLGSFLVELGQLARGQREIEEGLRLCRANGDRSAECYPLIHLSMLTLWQGEDARALALARTAHEIAVATRSRLDEIVALLCIGQAELALGRHPAASQAFEQAHRLAVALDSPMRHEALAGQARGALAQGDPTTARRSLDDLMVLDAKAGADGLRLDGCLNARLVELTCYRVLAGVGDLRAIDWLRRAHDTLQKQAARIDDAALRQSYLQNHPHHRDIVAAWGARVADGSIPA